jgi:hypothetical protein
MFRNHVPEIRRLAQDFLEGRLQPLEAALALSGYAHEDPPKALNDAFVSFILVASETDDVPLGERRALWHPDVRAKEDQKHDKAQAWARPIVEEACTRILATLDPMS